MRTFRPMQKKQAYLNEKPTLRTNKPVAAYARRSPTYAKDEEKDDSQSREMQTEDMQEWATNQGWEDHDFHPFFSDFGLSGTLRPDQRPDMFRLFDEIDAGKFDHGSVACWQENRLFRDETEIYSNQFIQKCLEHDILVVVVSPYLLIYDFRDEFMLAMFRWKMKESAEFIKRHVKGWMLPARYRAAWVDGEWAGLGDTPTGFIVDYDEESKTYKKLVPYWPHAEKKRELRVLFVELGCNISLLYQHLRTSPVIFPEFEEWVDPSIVNRFKMAKHPAGGYSPRSKNTIIALLTDVNDIGYRPIEGVIRCTNNGEKILDHDAICDRELFDLCYYPLAKTDLDGNPIAGRSIKRYYQKNTEAEYGLVKLRITSPQGRVYTHPQSTYEGLYIIEYLTEDALAHRIYVGALPCEEIDTLIVHRLIEHVRTISKNQDDIIEHEKRAAKQRIERQKKGKTNRGINTSN